MEELLKIRYNVMDIGSLQAFAGIKGIAKNGCKDVYFVRAAGAYPDLARDIEGMDRLLCGRMETSGSFYKRLSSLPANIPPSEADFYSQCIQQWISCGRTEMSIKLSRDDPKLKKILGKACCDTAELFKSSKTGVSASMEKNFIVRLIFRLDKVLSGLCGRWEEKKSVKIAAVNVEKLQDYLFYYLLTRLGADVLLIQFKRDIEPSAEKLELSKKIVLGGFGDCDIGEFDPEKFRTAVTENVRVQSNTVTASVGNSPVRVKLPPRNGRSTESAASTVGNAAGGDTLSRTGGNYIPSMTHNSSAAPTSAVNLQRSEKSFEELAKLASSVVMIAIHNEKGEVIGSGSGIMIGSGGYILTNNHVASGGRFYSVRIEDDGQAYTTDEVIKYNPVLDLAVIRIQRRLVPLKIYSGREKLVRGQKVVAIGSPLGLFNSVSDGIISGFRRIDNVDMIQFTAPTSHGSSGGAVLNMYGEVIGISTAGVDNAQNINLAVSYESVNTFIRGFTG